MATNFLAHEKIWLDKFKYEDTERKFYEQMNGPVASASRQSSAPGKTTASSSSGSNTKEEDKEARRLREEWLRLYAKKAKNPSLVAKSSILLDIKPWDNETDMTQLEACVRSIQLDGLVSGASKLAPVGYGIRKMQIQCVVEDDKVGTDLLEEEITKFEEHVQSVDIAALNKI
uniref:Translation elongation factor EF1B beta/delta subunit guanine nucleotide exchange domain-containing protein n=1 Tax=Gorilla gorilla gorilla TaxID=9595 RepID=G3S534_GORGO